MGMLRPPLFSPHLLVVGHPSPRIPILLHPPPRFLMVGHPSLQIPLPHRPSLLILALIHSFPRTQHPSLHTLELIRSFPRPPHPSLHILELGLSIMRIPITAPKPIHVRARLSHKERGCIVFPASCCRTTFYNHPIRVECYLVIGRWYPS